MNSQAGWDDREYVAEYYDVVYRWLGPKDNDFFIAYSKEAGGRTLELACGTGRVLIPTALAGCSITGLDYSAAMLDVCRDKLEQQPPEVRERVNLFHSNMAGFETGEKYLLVTIPFRAFQLLLAPEEHRACLTSAQQHLEEKGKIIIDVFNSRYDRLIPDSKYAEEIGDLPETPLPGGRKIRRTNRTVAWHKMRQYNEIELAHYITEADGTERRLTQLLKMRYFFRYEMEFLLELCGFRVVELFGTYDRSPLADDSPEMIFVAEKV